jgi:transposase InsO family protein
MPLKNTGQKKSRGRPKTSDEIIALIRKIHQENPLFSPEKIHEQLLLLNVIDAPAPNTIAKYLKSSDFKPKNPTEPTLQQSKQTWKTFLHNHRLWSMDFFIVPTATFQLLYVLFIINHASRKIEHVNVTVHPNTKWLKQQIREAMPFDHQPVYLLHDNDSMFTSTEFQSCLSHMNVESVRTSYRSPWQNGICERAVGIFKRDLIDHIIPFNERHLRRLLRSYVDEYYNTNRTHQGIDKKTPIPKEKPIATLAKHTNLKAIPVLNGLYYTYDKVSPYKDVA